MRGTITPDLRRFPDDRARFFTTVKIGKNGRMPPWGDLLNDDEIASLWAYISSRRESMRTWPATSRAAALLVAMATMTAAPR